MQEDNNNGYFNLCMFLDHAPPYLESVISPATKFQYAGLLVKRKIFNINFTRGLVYGWRLPFHQTLMVDGGFGSQRHFKVAVRAARESTTTSNRDYLTAAIGLLNRSQQQAANTKYGQGSTEGHKAMQIKLKRKETKQFIPAVCCYAEVIFTENLGYHVVCVRCYYYF